MVHNALYTFTLKIIARFRWKGSHGLHEMFHYTRAARRPPMPQFRFGITTRDVEHNDSIKVPQASLAHEGSIADDVQRWQVRRLFFVRRRAIDSRNHTHPRWQPNRRIIKISKSLSSIKSRERRRGWVGATNGEREREKGETRRMTEEAGEGAGKGFNKFSMPGNWRIANGEGESLDRIFFWRRMGLVTLKNRSGLTPDYHRIRFSMRGSPLLSLSLSRSVYRAEKFPPPSAS